MNMNDGSRRLSHGCFPLWSYSSTAFDEAQTSSKRLSYLCYLGSYKTRIEKNAAGQYITSSSSRFLWKVWHCERQGDTVSTDMFPGLTYDRRGGEYKSMSFLWRVFRYERNGADTKVHLFFIPVWRSHGERS
jgi:hypothetical protein